MLNSLREWGERRTTRVFREKAAKKASRFEPVCTVTEGLIRGKSGAAGGSEYSAFMGDRSRPPELAVHRHYINPWHALKTRTQMLN